MRWAWRRARSGDSRAVRLTGPEGIGKTRLAADVATAAAEDGALVLYASCLGVTSGTTEAVTNAGATDEPTLVVLDDLEGVDAGEFSAVADLLGRRRLLVVCAYREEETPPETQMALARLAGADAPSLRLGPVDEQAVRSIASLYMDVDAVSVPRLVEESRGVPGHVHAP